MQVSRFQGRTPFAQCVQTTIHDDFLEALLTNKRRTERYKDINPITSGGHARGFEARQILTFLVRRALGIFRIPGAYDLPLKGEHFKDLSIEEIEGACQDIKRLYDHTQAEMLKFGNIIKLVRGVSGVEASVCADLLKNIPGAQIPYFFQTITFFNHLSGAYVRNFSITIDCPISWVWVSAYTVRDLEIAGGSDEEFMVVCQSLDGSIMVPKKNFVYTPSANVLAPLVNVSQRKKELPNRLPEVISALTQDGFEPDKYSGLTASYKHGVWESRLARIGSKVDRLLSKHKWSSVYIHSAE
ncbi:TPA: hypothetical protein ACRNQ3_005980 [Pseudomonas aeruginosa]|nr:hypothetical protein [Pseudomonas aeruginosa]HBO3334064.1 hypothetical protein [Pseudomonas aeruginosa]